MKRRCQPVDENESVGRLPQHQPHPTEHAVTLLHGTLALGRRPNHINSFFHVLHLAHLPIVKALDEEAASVVNRSRGFCLVAEAVRLANIGLGYATFRRKRHRDQHAEQ